MIKILTFCTVSLLLFTGCLTKELPMQSTYSLSPKVVSIQQNFIPIDESILVLTPKTLASLNSTKIFYVSKKYAQEAYALSKWSNTPAKMLQQTIASKLANEKRYNFVTTTRLQESATIKISSEIVTFEQVINKDSSDVSLNLRVFITTKGKIFSKDFSYTKKAKANAYGAVQVFNEMAFELTNDISLYLQTIIKEK